jgi:hypothetical protein
MAGSYQISARGSKCDNSDFEWTSGNRHVAGDLVLGVSSKQAFEKGGCDDPGREELT